MHQQIVDERNEINSSLLRRANERVRKGIANADVARCVDFGVDLENFETVSENKYVAWSNISYNI